MWDIVGNVGAVGGIVEWPWVYSKVDGGRWLVCASVMHSSSDPGGGWLVVYGIVSIAGMGGGSGGGRAVVQATEGGGTTAVGPRHRHSLLVTSVSVV